jgi:hypothetical protein
MPGCSDLSGAWELVGTKDLTPMRISQSACRFEGRFDTVDHSVRHLVTGELRATAATTTVERWDPSGCYTRLYGLVRVDRDQLQWDITGSDGKCGVGSAYREHRAWRRIR